ncbi:MAG: DUF1887 family protein [Oscillospiraceae bacterium]|nr:DUF1887 family protein [Oscillospiraceae bacterium]
MTIVEFFEKSPFENMISCLAVKPDKVIFLGDMDEMGKVIPTYEQFLKKKHIRTKLERRKISRQDLKSIVQTLTDILKTERDCIFDITGGEDLTILGCGIVFAAYRDKYPVKLQRFDMESGKIIDCDGDGAVSFPGAFSFTVEEMIALQGGVVLTDYPQPDPDADKQDVDMLWNMARRELRFWNDSVKYLKEFEKRTSPEQDKMHIDIDLTDMEYEIQDYGRKLKQYTDFLEDLVGLGAIEDFWLGRNHISYSYKNAVVRRCLNSPGDILEMKVYFEARSMRRDGKPFFDSCQIGVNIDWDGVDRHDNDTRNEIDVILIRGLTPVFISCKIGQIQEIEPYKLWTVAERFGGKRVRKMLIASNFDRYDEKSELAFLNRAKEMGITFIANATQMSDMDWRNMLKNMVPW